ncbi:2Fe-2S iron-sulfur cluster-binding protein [Streptomyces sp. NPDC059853]|uniref:2Fe-2S iron-sulfur cluster-binding protein n=1 Tax=Streptomyces sp. NPDC059853 TaxID=3346973 RepID=UPI00365270FF
MAAFHPLRIVRREQLTDDAVALTLRVPGELAERFRYAAGQHLTVRHHDAAGAELRRTYSVCAPPPRGGPVRELTIGVRHIPGGTFSGHAVKDLDEGDTLQVLPPAGGFTLREDGPGGGHAVAVTGGSGITPVLAIAAAALERDPAARFTLLRSERTAAAAMFLEAVAELKDRYPGRLQLLYALTREERHTGPATGRLDSARLRTLLPALVPVAAVTDWYLCGPLGLIEAARTALGALGVARARVHAELFHAGTEAGAPPPPAPVPHAPGARLTATLGGQTATWPPRPGETVLETTLRNRPDAPYACKGGVCGTCRARLLHGEVRMARSYALEEDEVAAGYILPCQSHPATAVVEVDYDT